MCADLQPLYISQCLISPLVLQISQARVNTIMFMVPANYGIMYYFLWGFPLKSFTLGLEVRGRYSIPPVFNLYCGVRDSEVIILFYFLTLSWLLFSSFHFFFSEILSAYAFLSPAVTSFSYNRKNILLPTATEIENITSTKNLGGCKKKSIIRLKYVLRKLNAVKQYFHGT